MAYILSALGLVLGLAHSTTVAPPPAAQTSAARERPDTGRHELAWGRARRDAAMAMVGTLDMTSFPNSLGPRRVEGKRTLADYGFTKVEGFDDGWAQATMADGAWRIGIFVLDDGRDRKTLCITDTAVGGGTYNTTTAIAVALDGHGSWRATKVIGPVPGCR